MCLKVTSEEVGELGKTAQAGLQKAKGFVFNRGKKSRNAGEQAILQKQFTDASQSMGGSYRTRRLQLCCSMTGLNQGEQFRAQGCAQEAVQFPGMLKNGRMRSARGGLPRSRPL